MIDQLTDQVFAHQGDYQAETELRDALAVYSQVVPGWAVFAISDGTESGLARKQWERLLSLIEETYNKAQPVLEKQLVSPIKILSSSYETLRSPFTELLDDAEKHGRIKKGLFMGKEKKVALDAVTIGGHMPETSGDIRDILSYFEVLSLREQLGLLWDRLIASHGARSFSELGDSPERNCYQQRKAIDFWLKWMNISRNDLCTVAEKAGLGATLLQPIKTVAVITDDNASEMLQHIKEKLVPAVNLLHLVNELYSFTHSKENTLEMVMDCSASATCMNLQTAINEMSAEQYELAVNALFALKEKASIQERRSALLQKISAAAPAWADAIRNRMECHGESNVPEDLQTAWKVRQLAMIVDEITATPLSEAEKRVIALTAQFRKETEKLAGTLAWMYLQQRIDCTPSMRQALTGWKMTINKIGKGTGKRAPALRAEARKLMIECQKAVPAWIMPVSSVMSSIDAANTKFDVIIVDEASQSDITASAILWMGKKIIVVGDDEQVSPLSVGLDETKMQNLMNMLIKDKILNAHLWDARTSLYDIAAQVYRPLMLREHFRCVPDIIGYSNMLSYQHKIKPLREAGSSPFKTATVSYRVHGLRKGRNKVNEEEAYAIVALMKACIGAA